MINFDIDGFDNKFKMELFKNISEGYKRDIFENDLDVFLYVECVKQAYKENNIIGVHEMRERYIGKFSSIDEFLNSQIRSTISKFVCLSKAANKLLEDTEELKQDISDLYEKMSNRILNDDVKKENFKNSFFIIPVGDVFHVIEKPY